ncbi:MAG: hypothetical protein AAF600_13040 [Bacteroidota bacterium]
MKAPTLEEFIEHGEDRLSIMGEDPKRYRKSLISKYLAWSDNDWRTGNGRKIKNWKSTLSNTLPYLRAERIEVNEPKVIQANFLKDRYGIG